MALKIAAYSLAWQMKDNKGVVYLRDPQGNTGQIDLDSMEEFTAVSYILRNSKTVAFDSSNQKLVMEWTPPGS